MSETSEVLKKKLLYRSLNRGCKETDLLLTKFATKYLNGLNDAETSQYARFLDEDDDDIYKWFCRNSPLPAEYNILAEKLFAACKI